MVMLCLLWLLCACSACFFLFPWVRHGYLLPGFHFARSSNRGAWCKIKAHGIRQNHSFAQADSKSSWNHQCSQTWTPKRNDPHDGGDGFGRPCTWFNRAGRPLYCFAFWWFQANRQKLRTGVKIIKIDAQIIEIGFNKFVKFLWMKFWWIRQISMNENLRNSLNFQSPNP